MKGGDGLFSFLAQEEDDVVFIVLEEVFCEDCRTFGSSADGKV